MEIGNFTCKDEEFTDVADAPVKRITLAQANEFLHWRKKASVQIAAATFLCIIAVIPLLLLGGAAEMSIFSISENTAGGIGLVSLFVIVAAAVALFLHCGFKNGPYDFIDTESFETEYGVAGMVKERQKEYRNIYAKCNMAGTCICVLSPVPLFIGAFTEKVFLIIITLAMTLILAGMGAGIFIVAGVRWASMQKLLQEGDFSPEKKKTNKIKEIVATVYWLSATAIYLAWSFLTNDWEMTWIVWPIAGVLYAAVMAVSGLFIKTGD